MTVRALSIVLLALATAVPALADGWPRPKGSGYYQLGFRYVRATQFYEPNRNIVDIPTLSDYVVSFYGEYGLTERLTVLAYVPFVERITLNRVEGEDTGFIFFEGDAVTSIADADVGIRYGLFKQGNTVLSLSAKLGIPLGQTEQENGLITGDGELNQFVGLELGHSFWPAPAYATASAGFNNRINGFSDEFSFKVEGGYTLAQKLTLIGRVGGVFSLKNGDDPRLGGTGGLYGNNQQYVLYGIEASYTLTESVGIAVGAEGATLGENVLAAPAFRMGFFVVH